MDYLIVAAIGYAIGYWLRGIIIIMNLSRDPKRTIAMLEQLKKLNEEEEAAAMDATLDKIKQAVPDGTELFIEQVNGVFYAYNKESNRFVAQGSTLVELLETAHKRFPDSKFFGTVEEDNSTKQVAQ